MEKDEVAYKAWCAKWSLTTESIREQLKAKGEEMLAPAKKACGAFVALNPTAGLEARTSVDIALHCDTCDRLSVVAEVLVVDIGENRLHGLVLQNEVWHPDGTLAEAIKELSPIGRGFYVPYDFDYRSFFGDIPWPK